MEKRPSGTLQPFSRHTSRSPRLFCANNASRSQGARGGAQNRWKLDRVTWLPAGEGFVAEAGAQERVEGLQETACRDGTGQGSRHAASCPDEGNLEGGALVLS